MCLVIFICCFFSILVYGSKEQRPPEAVPKPTEQGTKKQAVGGGEDDRSKPPKVEQTEATRQGSKPLDETTEGHGTKEHAWARAKEQTT